MSKKQKRYIKSDFDSKKHPLPKTLEFLDGFNFHAVVEDSSGEKIKRIIEVTPASLKKTIRSAEKANEAAQKIDALTVENEELKNQLDEAIEHIRKLEHNNDVLMENLNHKPDIRHDRSPRNYFNVVNEAGVKTFGPPLQGGLPSLGKRK
jgi:predicted nuclease with TOPRIM domain